MSAGSMSGPLFSYALALAGGLVCLEGVSAQAIDYKPTALKLPGKASDIVAAAGGRLLVIRTGENEQVLVFDTVKRDIVHRIDKAPANALIAAGKTKLLVFKGATAERYDLATFRLEDTSALASAPEAVALGSNSDGPALVYWRRPPPVGDEVVLLDVHTLKPVPFEWADGKPLRRITAGRERLKLYAAADGNVFGGLIQGRDGVLSFRRDGQYLRVKRDIRPRGYALPSAGGGLIFSWEQVFTTELDAAQPKFTGMRLPAAQGAYYLRIPISDVDRVKITPSELHIHHFDSAAPLLRVTGFKHELQHPGSAPPPPFPTDKRLHFFPDQGLLVFLPPSEDRLEWMELKLEEQLRAGGKHYLFVAAEPPLSVAPGVLFEYAPVIKASAGIERLDLIAAPEGLALSEKGVLTWKARGEIGKAERVHLRVRDKEGKTLDYAFSLRLAASGADPAGDGLTVFRFPTVGSAALAPDGRTLVLSVPSLQEVVYLDSAAGRIVERRKVDFSPGILAVQNNTVVAASVDKPPSLVIFDLDTGKKRHTLALKKPILDMACHPTKGWLYAADADKEVFAIDPVSGTLHKTAARGHMVAVDTKEGRFVYTGVQDPIRDRILVTYGPKDSIEVQLDEVNQHALMFKFEADGKDLKAVGFNDNAAINGVHLAVSGDGKRVSMAGTGGWRDKKDPKANYSVAVFEAGDMKTLVGQVALGPFPVAVAFHPDLPYGAACRTDHEIVLFRDKSTVKKSEFKTLQKGRRAALLIAGAGKRLVFVPTKVLPTEKEHVLQIFDLPLTDEERALLDKRYEVHKKRVG